MGKEFRHHSLIPNFSLGQDFVYFNDLISSYNNNNAPAARRKAALYNAASSAVSSAMSGLSSAPNLDTALSFIQIIASNERGKELKVVKDYCDKIKEQYPNFTSWNEEEIMSNPNAFYQQLTKYINKAQQQTLDYKEQLNRIKRNAGLAEETLKKTSQSQYASDNYLYRLANDTTSLINNIIGTYQGNNKTANSFSNKLQSTVMDILNSQNIASRIKSGEDFAAIAAGVLADVEQQLQAEYDKQVQQFDTPKLLDKVSDETIEQIKQAYIKNVEEGKGTGIQQALKNIEGQDFARITQNIKKTLGIKQIKNPEKIESQLKKIKANAEKRRVNQNAQNRMIGHIRSTFARKKKLVASLQTLEFNNLSSSNFHGNLYELVEATINKNGFQLGNSGSATDVIRLTINVDTQDNQDAINMFANDIGKEISRFAIEDTHEKDALSRDLSAAITSMNRHIADTQTQLDNFLKEAEINQPIFIFHESLKLYSSIETGKSSSFSGRTLNILSAFDYIFSAMASVGIAAPGNLDTLRMLALNLSNLAVGGHAKGALEDYLSLFAGLLMFDDINNMAQEAANIIQYDNVNTIHLYLLNGVYVPSSMILTYVYDNLNEAMNMISSGDAASVSISTSGADAAISNWLGSRPTPEPEIWSSIGAAAASGTQVHIAFFAGFLNFISSL